MAENNNRRKRKAFADFKENQYEDSFSLDNAQMKKNKAKKITFQIVIIALAVIFIIVGFIFTDALMKVSEKPYEDKSTYTASTTQGESEEEDTTEESEPSEENTENSENEEESSSYSYSEYSTEAQTSYYTNQQNNEYYEEIIP